MANENPNFDAKAKEARDASAAIEAVLQQYEAAGANPVMLRVAAIAQAAHSLGVIVNHNAAAQTLRLIASKQDPASREIATTADAELARVSRAQAELAHETIDRAKVVVKVAGDVTRLAIEAIDEGHPELARELLAGLGTKLLPPDQHLKN